MLAAASSGIGERQEGVKRFGTRIVARFGKVRQSGKRAREQQRLGRNPERIGMQVGIVYMRGYRVNSALQPTYVQISCLGCCSW